MADVNDAGNLAKKLARQLELLEEADIDERDRDAIRAFYSHRRARGNETTTLTADLSTLRCASERADVALVDMSKTDVDDLLTSLATPKDEGGYGLQPNGSGIFGYCRGCRVFFRWLDERDDYGAFPFADEIDLPKQQFSPPSEDELLSPTDVQALKNAAGRGGMNVRDRALIAFLADGPRVTLAAQLRVGDVNVYDPTDPYWRPNEDAIGQKGLGDDDDDADIRPFLWSTHEVRMWLSHGHPDPDNPAAPLWTRQQYDPENPREGALSPDGIRSMLERNAELAGVEKAVNPHSFRHAAITRARREEVDVEHLRVVAGWADLRPAKAYDHVTDAERNASVRGQLGLSTPEVDEDTEPPLTDCWSCGRDVERDARYCSGCGHVQDQAARLAANHGQDAVREGLSEDPEDPTRTQARAALQAALNDPDVLAMVSDALSETTDN